MALSDAVKQQADAIMASEDVANLKVQKLNALWTSSGLASYQKHTPDRFLIHPMNRGGSMLNGHDMISKGERVLSQGLREDLLDCSAVAFGLSSNLRQGQIEANRKLAAQFSSCMASPQGKELFMTVGSSHTTCFLKSLMFGKIEQSTNSCMQSGHPVQEALVSGWTWHALSGVLEQQWPGLPLLYSSVLLPAQKWKPWRPCKNIWPLGSPCRKPYHSVHRANLCASNTLILSRPLHRNSAGEQICPWWTAWWGSVPGLKYMLK